MFAVAYYSRNIFLMNEKNPLEKVNHEIDLDENRTRCIKICVATPIPLINYLTPWLIEPADSILHSQGLSNSPYPKSNQPNYSYWHLFLYRFLISSPHLGQGLPTALFPLGLPVKILKILPSSILTSCPVHLLDLITLPILASWS